MCFRHVGVVFVKMNGQASYHTAQKRTHSSHVAHDIATLDLPIAKCFCISTHSMVGVVVVFNQCLIKIGKL